MPNNLSPLSDADARQVGDLLNIFLPWQVHALGAIDLSSRREWSKKHALSLFEESVQTCPERSRRKGRSSFDARSVLLVREHGKRERMPPPAFFNIPIGETTFDRNVVLLAGPGTGKTTLLGCG
jgi:hypothetical protein